MEIQVEFNKIDSEPESLPYIYKAIDDIVEGLYPVKVLTFVIPEVTDIVIYLCKSNAVMGPKELVFQFADDSMIMLGKNMTMYFSDSVGKQVNDYIVAKHALIDKMQDEVKQFEAFADILISVAKMIYVDNTGELVFLDN